MNAELTDEDLLARWSRVVAAVTHAQQRVAERIEETGVPSQWFPALRALLHAEDHRLPMSHLARQTAITSGGFTKLADRMGREGLIDRRNSSGDRRVVYATLTEAGLEVAARAEEKYLAAMREHVLLPLTPDQLAVVSDALASLESPAADETEGLISARDPDLPDRRRQANRRV